MNQHIAVANLLIDLEYQLRVLQLWEVSAPDEAAFASTAPFHVDTMAFPQWLQWVFLPRMQSLVRAEAPLPQKCDITPMAEEYFAPLQQGHSPLLGVLREIDNTLSN